MYTKINMCIEINNMPSPIQNIRVLARRQQEADTAAFNFRYRCTLLAEMTTLVYYETNPEVFDSLSDTLSQRLFDRIVRISREHNFRHIPYNSFEGMESIFDDFVRVKLSGEYDMMDECGLELDDDIECPLFAIESILLHPDSPQSWGSGSWFNPLQRLTGLTAAAATVS
jgi:hypothetical protein